MGLKEVMEFTMTVEEVAKKFCLEIEEVEPDYYKVLNPKKISLTKFKDCFDKCILIYKDAEYIENENHWLIEEKGVIYYFTPFLDEEHSKIEFIADAAGLELYCYAGYDHDFKEDNGIDSIFLKGELS